MPMTSGSEWRLALKDADRSCDYFDWQVSTFLLFVLPMVLITVLYIRIGVALRRSTVTTTSYHHHQQQQQQQLVAEATPPPPPPTPAGAPAECPGRVTRVTPARVAQSRKSIFKMLGECALLFLAAV